MRTNLTQAEAEKHFARLATLLPMRFLPTKNGGKRLAEVYEFMLMYTDDAGSMAAFKHRDSRNYVYIKKDVQDGDYLTVPKNQEFGHGGYFDTFDN